MMHNELPLLNKLKINKPDIYNQAWKCTSCFEANEDEEHLCSIIVNLFKNLKGSSLERLTSKFLESNLEKIDRIFIGICRWIA